MSAASPQWIQGRDHFAFPRGPAGGCGRAGRDAQHLLGQGSPPRRLDGDVRRAREAAGEGNDGKRELVTANPDSGSLLRLLESGDRTFGTPRPVTTHTIPSRSRAATWTVTARRPRDLQVHLRRFLGSFVQVSVQKCEQAVQLS